MPAVYGIVQSGVDMGSILIFPPAKHGRSYKQTTAYLDCTSIVLFLCRFLVGDQGCFHAARLGRKGKEEREGKGREGKGRRKKRGGERVCSRFKWCGKRKRSEEEKERKKERWRESFLSLVLVLVG